MIPGFAALYPGYALDRRPRRVARDERIELAREAIREAARAQGLHFE